MSNLLSQASLVMIPSGYKEDVVYSQIPTSGAGDLSFTRASNGTRINSAGLVEVCPWNFIEYSEQFTNAAWATSNGATVSADQTTAPNGTTTADKIVFPANSAANIYNFPSSPIGANNISIYAKTLSGTKQFRFRIDTGSGPAVSSNFTATTEWQRFDFAVTTTATNLVAYVFNDSVGVAGDLYVWGAQLNIGSTAKPYFPTTDRLNVPRLTYQNGGGGCPSLLLEKQSTNLVTYSEQFDDASWSIGGASVTANNVTSPDGTQNADKLVENTTSTTTHYINKATSLTATSYTLSVFAKAAERKWIFLIATTSADLGAFFDLENGVVGTVSSGYTAAISNVGNGWYRCSITFTATATTWYSNFLTATANNTYNYSGTIGSGIYIWGAQLEASSYATSYIPTTTASATRVADACFKTGISSLIGQTEGVLFWDGVATQGNYNQLIFIKDSSVNQFIGITVGTNVIYGEIYNSGYVHLFSYAIASNESRFKLALAYKTNDFAMYVNGVQVSSASTGTTPTSFDDFYLGNTNNLRDLNCEVKEAILFPTRLTNAELASLTTI